MAVATDDLTGGSGNGGMGLDSSGGTAGLLSNTNLSCSLSLDTVPLRSLEFILPTVTLGLLNVVVIIGNALVIGAVFTSAKLRTTTNGFVCSLAVADLLVGLMVLPFSNANEVLRYWVFGPIWCSVWLAVDVWLCTASILNLVAISFDRYIAISRPFKYHSLLSPKRGKFLVCFVWILSFVICFPPLIGWNEQGKGLGNRFKGKPGGIEGTDGMGGPNGFNASGHPFMNTTNDTSGELWGEWSSGSGDTGTESGAEPLGFEASAESLYVVNVRNFYNNYSYLYMHGLNGSVPPGGHAANNNLHPPEVGRCDVSFPECGLTSEPGYIVYSALGSFWIPMIIMSAFYWKIYRTAVKSTAALKHGMLTTKAGTELSSGGTSESVTLRIHRGGGGAYTHAVRTSENGKRRSGTPASYPKCHYRSAYGSSGRESAISETDTVFINTHPSKCSSASSASSRSKKYRDPKVGRNGKHKDVRLGSLGPQPDFPLLGKHPDDRGDYFNLKIKQKKKRLPIVGRNRSERDRSLIESLTDDEPDTNGVGGSVGSGGGDGPVHETKTMAFLRKSRRKNIKLELQKLNKEKKAAKTVGIIVGCFVLCWLPFFTVYLMGAFCPSCTPPLVFSIFFWLGYCNSAINPCVYALFSRDFRCAFKKLLRCNCRVEPQHNKHQLGFVSRLHSFRLQASSRSNESNSE